MTAWSNFYLTTGSAAAALTGLMFVVVTLSAGRERARRSPEGISTFSTPNVLHFSAALLASLILMAPWRQMLYPTVLLGLTGLYGVVHILRVAYMTSRLTAYRADIEDWTWYTIVPFIAYASILAGAIMLSTPVEALFVLAAGIVLLIFTGIHNAWDVVTYLVIHFGETLDSDSQES